MDVILHLLPINLHIFFTATCGAVRLRESGLWKGRPFGHGDILRETFGGRGVPKTDYVIPRLEFGRNFGIRLPSRNEWKRGDVLRGYDTVLYTDGSKMETGVGAGVFSETLDIERSYRLPNHSSVFQAETLAISKACGIIREDDSPLGRIAIATDSQAAIQALGSSRVGSAVVRLCLSELKNIGGGRSVTLVWVPGHRNIPGNERADELARQGAGLDMAWSEDVHMPLNTLRRETYLKFVSRANDRWKGLTTCRRPRLTWPAYDRSRSDQLVALPRGDIARAVAMCTGHWPVGRHAARLGIPHNDYCRSCKDGAEEETLEHYLCECPALAGRRFALLGGYVLEGLGDIAKVAMLDLVRYANTTGWI